MSEPRRLHSIARRLQNNFQLSIITLLGVSGSIAVFPFILYRIHQRDWLTAAVDSVVLILLIGSVTYSWRTNDTRYGGIALAIVVCSGGILVATLQPGTGMMWLYPAFLTSFFLMTPRLATGMNLAAITTLVLLATPFSSLPQQYAFIMSGLIVCVCAYLLAERSEIQRSKLEHLVRNDPLTDVKNRRAMEEEIRHALTLYLNTSKPHSLIIMDIDHFKRINDRHGHHVGDGVLVHCAKILRRNIRVSDSLYRFGGEEFVILLPGVEPENLSGMAEKLRAMIEKELRCPDGPVTASFGAADLEPGDNPDSWLNRADKALYAAKKSGRNQVVVSGSEAEKATVI